MIVIGRKVLGQVAADVSGPVALLSQPGAASIAGTVRGSFSDAIWRELPDGEDAKRLSVVEETVAWLADNGITRDGLIVAVGGGALTDVAGFIASVYLRGVEARYVPTTVLGAVDAAIGGKTAVNVQGKNLVGTFAHPERVIIDIELLEQLDDAIAAMGLAEALKAGLIGDVGLFELLEREGAAADLEEVVRRSVAVKTRIVEADFRESGIRTHLNFGHTIGHAVESVAAWPHGHAVAVGMVAAAAISEDVAAFDGRGRVVESLRRLGLPTGVGGISRTDVVRLVQRDKKSDAEGLRMVLLEDVGSPTVRRIDAATLDLGLLSIGIS